MMSNAETLVEEVSVGHPSKPFAPAPPCIQSRFQSRSAPHNRGRSTAPRALATTARATPKKFMSLILNILHSTAKANSPPTSHSGTTPTPPPSASFILHHCCATPIPNHRTYTTSALASTTVGMSNAVKKHQTNSLFLLRSSAGPGKNFESKFALLQKKNASLMLMATTSIQAADGTEFLLETLFEVTRLEEKEAHKF